MFRGAAQDGIQGRTAGEHRVWGQAFLGEPDVVRPDAAQASAQVWKVGGNLVLEQERRDEPDEDRRDGEQAEAQVWLDEERRGAAPGLPDAADAEPDLRDAEVLPRGEVPAEAEVAPLLLRGEAAGPSCRQSSGLPENRETCVYSYFHLVPVYAEMTPFPGNSAQKRRPASVSMKKSMINDTHSAVTGPETKPPTQAISLSAEPAARDESFLSVPAEGRITDCRTG